MSEKLVEALKEVYTVMSPKEMRKTARLLLWLRDMLLELAIEKESGGVKYE